MALELARDGTDIWVARGDYEPDPVDQMFSVGAGIRVYGGFAGGEITRESRDWRTNVCVLNGEGMRVLGLVSMTGGGAPKVLDGFIITNSWRLGVQTRGSSAIVANCVFRNNGIGAIQGGGRLELVNSLVEEDYVHLAGGGYVVNSAFASCRLLGENFTATNCKC